LLVFVFGSCIAFWTIGFARQESNAGRSLWPLLISIPFWLVVAYGVRLLFASVNERIILTPNQLVWTDFLGRERLRVSYAEISDVTFKTSRTDRETWTTATVRTGRGDIKYTSYISDYSRLCILLKERIGQGIQVLPEAPM